MGMDLTNRKEAAGAQASRRPEGDVFLEITGGQGEITTKCTAQCYYKNGSYYLLFQETIGEGGKEDKDAVTFSSRLKISDGQVTLHRSVPAADGKPAGKVMEIVYRRQADGERGMMVNYPTPYGVMALEVMTDHLEVQETESELKVLIHYRMLQNGQEAVKDRLLIRAVKKG
ncbi:MAG: DUF1934 domain-containing protein [Lachnospiraceae bacterium]|nr:DUF1934 domain-containing protein [Lachnospiraceae bacterium]